MASDTTVIAVAVRGNGNATIHRRGNGIVQATRASTGTIWLCPQGIQEDKIRITDAIPRMLHIYLPTNPFTALSQEDGYPDVTISSVRYDAGFQDRLVTQIAEVILAELGEESGSGKLLVETAALTLSARLLHAHSSVDLPYSARAGSTRPLDPVRLRRVIEFINANLKSNIGVGDLAAVACLSQFHFSRSFKRATGMPPHRFVAIRRLEASKTLLEKEGVSLAEVALISNFSSQAGFTRAFRRVTGMSPGAYRHRSK